MQLISLLSMKIIKLFHLIKTKMVDDIFIPKLLITENHSESDQSENNKFAANQPT